MMLQPLNSTFKFDAVSAEVSAFLSQIIASRQASTIQKSLIFRNNEPTPYSPYINFFKFRYLPSVLDRGTHHRGANRMMEMAGPFSNKESFAENSRGASHKQFCTLILSTDPLCMHSPYFFFFLSYFYGFSSAGSSLRERKRKRKRKQKN